MNLAKAYKRYLAVTLFIVAVFVLSLWVYNSDKNDIEYEDSSLKEHAAFYQHDNETPSKNDIDMKELLSIREILNIRILESRLRKGGYRNQLQISRENFFESSFGQCMNLDVKTWKLNNFSVNFEGEPGVDVGGLTKEWINLCVESFFTVSGLFEQVSERNTTYKPKADLVDSTSLIKYRFVGRILAECLIRNISTNFPLADYIYAYILGRKDAVTVEVVKDLDEENYNFVMNLLDPENSYYLEYRSWSDITDLCSDVEIPSYDVVNAENVKEYVDLHCYAYLVGPIKQQLDAIKSEFDFIMDNVIFEALTPVQFKYLVSGTCEIDADDWKTHTRVIGADTPEERKTAQIFWEILKEFTNKQRSDFLFFCTGSPQPPFGGFGKLVDAGKGFKICFQPPGDVRVTAHTCFNGLVLPVCLDKEALKLGLENCCNYNRGFSAV